MPTFCLEQQIDLDGCTADDHMSSSSYKPDQYDLNVTSVNSGNCTWESSAAWHLLSEYFFSTSPKKLR